MGEFQLEPATRRLFRADGTEVHLSQKPFLVLLHLVENRHRLVTRTELIGLYWNEREVYDQALTRCLSSIRKALDDQVDPPRYIETRWAEGYRYIGPHREIADAAPAAASAKDGKKPCPFCRAMAAVAALAVVAAATIVHYVLRDPAPGSPSIQRIAVLPLRHDASVEPWLAEGMSDRMIHSLSLIDGLHVVARGSAQRFAAGAPDAREIGEALGVQAFLSGTVALNADALHLSARLTSTADGTVLWTFETDHPRADLMSAEREVALALATRLSARLRTAPVQTQNELAYERFLEARHQWNRRTEASLRRALELYESALAADPRFVDAHVGAAEVQLVLPLYAGEPPAPARAGARAAAEAALRLDPHVGGAHRVLAIIAQFDWDWARTDGHFLDAVAANPNDATALQWYAESLCYRRRFDDCRTLLREALALDPLSPTITLVQGIAARWAGDLPAAQAAYQTVRTRWPGFAFAEFEQGQLASQRHMWPEAIERYRAVGTAFGIALSGGQLTFAYARAGRRAEALALRDELRAVARQRYIPPTALAVAELGLGNVDEALALLERAVDTKDELVIYLGVDHHFRELDSHPRFRALLERTGLHP